MQGFDNRDGMTHGIEKIRVTERKVLRARGDLLADIREHNFGIDQAKRTVVDRDDGAMPAMMLASATRFRVTDGAMLPAGKDKMCVGFQRRQAVPIGDYKVKPLQ